jgi:hypothetical protein
MLIPHTETETELSNFPPIYLNDARGQTSITLSVVVPCWMVVTSVKEITLLRLLFEQCYWKMRNVNMVQKCWRNEYGTQTAWVTGKSETDGTVQSDNSPSGRPGSSVMKMLQPCYRTTHILQRWWSSKISVSKTITDHVLWHEKWKP